MQKRKLKGGTDAYVAPKMGDTPPKKSLPPLIRVLCAPNIFGKDTPKNMSEVLEEIKNLKLTAFRFTFFLDDLMFIQGNELLNLDKHLKYGYFEKDPDADKFEFKVERLFYQDHTDKDKAKFAHLEYLKPLILKLKQFESELKKENNMSKDFKLFTNIHFKFITINELDVQEEEKRKDNSIHQWHTDVDDSYDYSIRQFSILLTKHPNTQFTKNLETEQEKNKDDNPIRQCPHEEINSASYWNSLVFHRKPMYNTNEYENIRSIATIMFDLEPYYHYTKTFYDSPEHIQKEINAFKNVFENISYPKPIANTKNTQQVGGNTQKPKKQTIIYKGTRHVIQFGKRGGAYIMLNNKKQYVSLGNH